MGLKDMKGNHLVISRLLQAVENQAISHAYIFEGDDDIYKALLAENFLKAILCKSHSADACEQCTVCKKIQHGNYEDLYYVGGESGSIKDEEIEEMQIRLKKKPVAGQRNTVIIRRAESMTLRAQNRLLKTLEEPFPGTVIILLCQNIEALAATILSRCIVYRLKDDSAVFRSDYYEKADKIGTMLLAGERFFRIAAEMNAFTDDRQVAVMFLEALEIWFRDLLIAPFDKQGCMLTNPQDEIELKQKSRLYRRDRVYQGLSAAEESKQDLNRNMNVSYTLKSLILQLS